jgi:hypothetical protein
MNIKPSLRPPRSVSACQLLLTFQLTQWDFASNHQSPMSTAVPDQPFLRRARSCRRNP